MNHPAIGKLTKAQVEEVRSRLGDRAGVEAVCDAALAWLVVSSAYEREVRAFMRWRAIAELTDRERLLIATLNPAVLGQDMVDLIHRVTGVEPYETRRR